MGNTSPVLEALLARGDKISSYTPTLRERVVNALATNWFGDTRDGVQQAKNLSNVLETVTPYGAATMAYDAGRAGGSGDYLGAGLMGAMAMAPGAKLRAFHASPHDFSSIKPSAFRGASFFASTPERAKRGASAGINEFVMDTATELPKGPLNMYQAEIDPFKIHGLAMKPKEIEWFNSLPDKIVGDEALSATIGNKMPYGMTWDDLYEAKQVGGNLFEYVKKSEAPTKSFDEAIQSGRDIYNRQWPHYGPGADESGSAKRILSEGMGGYLVQDEGGLSIAVADPSIISDFRKHPQGIRAFHGSPHSFDKFSMDKIGTGEGAQAYGHGLYFAENEGVAKDYRNQLSPGAVWQGAPARAIADTDEGYVARQVLMEMGNGVSADEAIKRVQKQYKDAAESAQKAYMDESLGYSARMANKNMAEQRAKFAAAASSLRSGDFSINPGSMYEVRINANPDDFLDWDKPLSEQPESVRKAYAKAAAGDDPILSELLDGSPESLQITGLFPKSSGAQAYNTFASGLEPKLPPDPHGTPSGWGHVQRGDGGQPFASQKLREAGIPGIKYLDAGSRGKGDGSRNYVVFDDKLIEIVKKYGIAGASALLGMDVMSNMNDAQAQSLKHADAAAQFHKFLQGSQ